jgi:IS4 transposase
MRLLCGYHKSFKRKHAVRYLLYVVNRVKVALNQIHHYYRERFGIETRYRYKTTVLSVPQIKSQSSDFLFVALAFILVNLWIYLI